MIYDVDYFINKFQAIPEEMWITRLYERDGAHCAFGHCGMTCNGNNYNEESNALYDLIDLGNSGNDFDLGVLDINDGKCEKYKQSTPKQRILAALYDIKKMLSKEQEVQASVATEVHSSNAVGTTKIIHHYVSVPETIKEQSKELILS